MLKKGTVNTKPRESQTDTLPEGPPPTSRPLPTCPEGGVKAPRDFPAFLHHGSHDSVLFNTRLLPLGYKAFTSFTAMSSQCLRKVCGWMKSWIGLSLPILTLLTPPGGGDSDSSQAASALLGLLPSWFWEGPPHIAPRLQRAPC